MIIGLPENNVIIGMPKCKVCGEELCTGDYGYYCGNQNCPEYDKNTEVYEVKDE